MGTLPRTPPQAVAYALNQVVHPSENYYDKCDHFVAKCYGLPYSGYLSAAQHWRDIPAKYKHSGTPPAGGVPFWSIGTFGHVAISVGSGNIVSNDIVRVGRVSVVRLGAPVAAWGARYLGWTDPYYHGDMRIIGANVPKPTPKPAVKPNVSLSWVQKAAMTDPKAPQGHHTYTYGVTITEHALALEGLLAPAYVDGSYGTLTITAYSKWQRKLGYSGVDANGIPGRLSLTSLGLKHGFNVVA